MNTRCTTSRAGSLTRPTSSSIASRIAGGTTTTSRAKTMISPAVEPRAAKNSGLSESRLKSGWASAKALSTARWAKASSGETSACVRR